MTVSVYVKGLTVSIVDTAPPVTQTPTLAAGVLASFPSPTDSSKGVIGGKHVTCTLHPPSGRIYMNGGDFINPKYANSYQQQTWSLDPAVFIAAGGGNAGWRLEYPYDGYNGAVQPWHPDYTGFPWDPFRGVFWMVPGLMVAGNNLNYLSPPASLVSTNSVSGAIQICREVMTFNPTLQRWQRPGVRADVPGGEANADDTHDAVYDPVKDVIVRPGRNGQGVCFDILDCKTLKWRTVSNPFPNIRGPWQTQLQGEPVAVDWQKRMAYQCDLFGNLCRWSLDDYSLSIVASLPGGALTTMANYTTLIFDSVNRVLLYSRAQLLAGTAENPGNLADGFIHVCHVDSGYMWEPIPEKTSDGSRFTHRMACFVPSINATLFFGGILDYASLANARLYFFRYK